MKNVIILFIINFSANLIAQNEKVNRDALTVKLEYEQKIDKSPYFIKPNTLQMFPSESVLMEVDVEGESIKSMKIVEDNFNPEKTVLISFNQKGGYTEGNIMMLEVKNPLNQILSFDAYIYTLSKKDWSKTSIIPVQAKSSSIEIWQDAIVAIVMENWNVVPIKNTTVEHTTEQNSTTDQIWIEKTLTWIERNKIELNKLPFALPEEINITCDSSLYLKHIKGDTTIYWTYGWQMPMDTIQASEWVKNPKYGKTAYFSKVNWDGTLESVDLITNTFRILNDSIFELEQLYKISNDSLSKLLFLAYENEDEEKGIFYENIIENNIYQKFKLIYHPNIFKNGIYEGNCNKDIIKLVDSWDCKGKKYFAIEISNFRINGEEYLYTMVFDENYKWLGYDGCDKNGSECLKNVNFEVHYR